MLEAQNLVIDIDDAWRKSRDSVKSLEGRPLPCLEQEVVVVLLRVSWLLVAGLARGSGVGRDDVFERYYEIVTRNVWRRGEMYEHPHQPESQLCADLQGQFSLLMPRHHPAFRCLGLSDHARPASFRLLPTLHHTICLLPDRLSDP